MKNLIKYSLFCLVMLSFFSCKKDWLDRQSQTILGGEQVMNDPNLIAGLLANYYDRLPADYNLQAGSTGDKYAKMTLYDDAVWSNSTNTGEENRNTMPSYIINTWTLWDYTLIRDINLSIENLDIFGTKLIPAQKVAFNAEFRFLRAYVYFETVKRMGGVPLITTQLLAGADGNVADLKKPRDKEAAIYDFVASECDAIKNLIGNGSSNTRANKYAVLALKSRAMLHAASVAKYNNLVTPSIILPNEVVGIPASKANAYYQMALDAAKEIILSPAYSLYKGNPNLGENFYEAITKKQGNKEVILAQDYLQSKGRVHGFSYRNIAFSLLEDVFEGSAVTPSLNLVESYDYLDGSKGTMKTRTSDNSDFIYYNRPEDIFANKDARLYGTVIYPGTTFKGKDVALQAGVMEWDGTKYKTTEGPYGSVYTDGKTLTGQGGPTRTGSMISCTGFYLKKYIDPVQGSATSARQSDMWWIRFRLGEVYLNAAEAAFELGLPEALGYINTLRQRAGFPENSLTTLSLDKILNERRCELAFEDHRVWDLIRTRKATTVWDGVSSNPNAMQRALYGYRVIRPGDAARDGKYVYVELVAPRFKTARNFQMQNYYSEIPQDVRSANDLIIPNPFH